jgi:hypothetical protein
MLVVRAGRPGDEPELLRVFPEAARAAWAHILSPEAFDAYGSLLAELGYRFELRPG